MNDTTSTHGRSLLLVDDDDILRERMAKMGVEIVASSPEDFDKFIRAEFGKWSGVAKQAGVKGE